MEYIPLEKLYDVVDKLKPFELSFGFEFHPFQIGWYNEQVGEKFKLPYEDEVLAMCVISTPSFFDNIFLPYVCNYDSMTTKDPFDQCVTDQMNSIKELFDVEVDIIYDYEVHPSRRPKILVQTAGHVSGAAYYYQKNDVKNMPWGDKKVCGVSLHHRYGGWFSFRGALVFKDYLVSEMERKEPVDNLSNEQKIKLLDGFNFHWKEWWFRDVSNPKEKYSDFQKKYFETKPSERKSLIQSYIQDKMPSS